MRFAITIFPLLFACAACAAELKVDLNPPDTRQDILTPHWENWAWHTGASGSRTFGNITVTFRAPANEVLAPVLYKGLLDCADLLRSPLDFFL